MISVLLIQLAAIMMEKIMVRLLNRSRKERKQKPSKRSKENRIKFLKNS
jgi:hypothetical protein